MSSYHVLHEVSEILRTALWEEFAADDEIRVMFGGEERNGIVFTNPTESLRESQSRLSLWLYRIEQDQFTQNQPRARTRNGEQLRDAPLTLGLSFLVTPLRRGAEDLLLLGKTMQVLHANPIIPVRQSSKGIAEDLRVTLRRLTLEELTRVWEALREPYRLSVCYQVRVTHIHGEAAPGAGRIRRRDVAPGGAS